MSFLRNVYLIVFVGCFFSCATRNRTSPADIVEIYYDYLQIWEFERAYNFLSDSLQKNVAQFSYRPNSIYGDWWKTCCFIKDFYISANPASKIRKSKVYFMLFDLTSWSKKDFIAELKEENHEWKIAYVGEFDPLKDSVLQRSDDNQTLLIKKADSLFKNNKLKSASQIYMKLVEKYPFNAEYHAKLGYLLTLIAYKEKELWERGVFKYMPYAQSEYDIALQLEEGNITAHLAKGLNNYWTPGTYGDLQSAIVNFEFVLKHEPSNYIACYYLNKLYKKCKMNKRISNKIASKRTIHQELLGIE